MAIMRVMFVGQGASGLPADRIVNTFHFSNPDEYVAHQGVVIPLLKRIFAADGGIIPPMTRCIGEWLSPWVQRSASLVAYDLNTAIPRVPTVYPITLPAPFSGGGGIEEAALCLSLKAADPPHTPRRRGRVYFGPFNLGAFNAGSDTEQVRPSSFLVEDLLDAGELLIDTAGVDWMIRSTRPTQNFVRIGGVWVDNAFDTQRRRGPAATSREERP